MVPAAVVPAAVVPAAVVPAAVVPAAVVPAAVDWACVVVPVGQGSGCVQQEGVWRSIVPFVRIIERM